MMTMSYKTAAAAMSAPVRRLELCQPRADKDGAGERSPERASEAMGTAATRARPRIPAAAITPKRPNWRAAIAWCWSICRW